MVCSRALPLARFAILAATGLAPFESAIAVAQGAPDQRIEFDIPAQPLDTALTLYFRATGVQLLYDSSITANRRSSPIKGRFAPREALAILLRGTGLVARYSRASAAVLTTPERDGAPIAVPLGRVVVREKIRPARASMVDRLAYYGQLESTLEAHLREDSRTRRLAFAVAVALEVNDTGHISAVKVQRSSGSSRTDRLILETLSGRAVMPPPEGIAQPLLIALRGRPGAPSATAP